MREYLALSIMSPAVDNVLLGIKNIEIRSWVPSELPIYNLVLVQNNKYLHEGEIDSNGVALAVVDVLETSDWTYSDYLRQSNEVTLGREWKEGYHFWKLENIRKIVNKPMAVAKGGIYKIILPEIIVEGCE